MVLRDITSFHLPRPTPSLYFPSSKSKRNWLHTGITFSRTEETFQLNREGKAKRKPGGFYSQILVIHSWIIRVLIGFARNLSPRPHPPPHLFRGSSREFTRCTQAHKSAVITVRTHRPRISISRSIRHLDKLMARAQLVLLVEANSRTFRRTHRASVCSEYRHGFLKREVCSREVKISRSSYRFIHLRG